MSAPETYFGPWEGPKALWSSGLSPLVLGRPAVSEQMLVSFSPSDQDYLNALEAYAGYFVPIDRPATELSPIDQNHASVVVVVRADQEFLLQGGDLERTVSPHTGWNAVVASETRPQFLAKLFKVPHHGSSNGQSIEVWTKMLENAGPPACRSTRSFR